MIRCPDCGAFCSEAPTYAGSAGYILTRSCINCGRNPPDCSQETGTVYGCQKDATHYGAPKGSTYERPWCEKHAPENAEPYPYVQEGTE